MQQHAAKSIFSCISCQRLYYAVLIFAASTLGGGLAFNFSNPNSKISPIRPQITFAEIDFPVEEKPAVPYAVVADFTLDKSVKHKLSGRAVAIKLEQALCNKYRLLTRRQIGKAMEELRFQNSDLVNNAKAKEFGKFIGAEYIITGDIVQFRDEITLACQIFNTETGVIKNTAEVTTYDIGNMSLLVQQAAKLLNTPKHKRKKAHVKIETLVQDQSQNSIPLKKIYLAKDKLQNHGFSKSWVYAFTDRYNREHLVKISMKTKESIGEKIYPVWSFAVNGKKLTKDPKGCGNAPMTYIFRIDPIIMRLELSESDISPTLYRRDFGWPQSIKSRPMNLQVMPFRAVSY